MSTEKFALEQGTVTQKEQYFTAAGQINVRSGRARVSNTSGASFEITLPPVAQAQGRFYSILATAANGTSSITISHDDDSERWGGDITLNGAGDRALMYSDGKCWHTLSLLTYADTTAPPTTAAPQV